MKQSSVQYIRKIFLAAGIVGLLVTVLSPVVGAIANGYATTDSSIQPGMAVSIDITNSTNTPTVVRATNSQDSQPIGVTVNVAENLVTTGAVGQTVYVQSEGEVEAFVSDLNGVPKKGDLLAVSPLRGILVVAAGTDSIVVGSALEDFVSEGSVAQTVSKDGGSVAVQIDKIRISLDQKSASSNLNSIDSSLERLGRSVVGKDVGEIRVLIALVIFLIVLIAEGGIIYGAVSSAITSLGRNPMAKQIIVREMIRVIMIAIVVLMVGLAAIYGILWV